MITVQKEIIDQDNKYYDNGNRSIILTTVANASVEKIHNRMPVILEKNMIDRWLEAWRDWRLRKMTRNRIVEDYQDRKMGRILPFRASF